MGRIEKTVFISYRRTNLPWALCIYQNLTMHGYDVFFDYQSIDSGNFEKVILENIKSRAHFLVVLTPSALERLKEPNDWLRREIETAMDEKRNIVPLMLESFDFGSPLVTQALTGKLAALKNYNGLRVYAEYFFEAMDKLRERYMNVEVSGVVSLNAEAKGITEVQKTAANEAPQVEKEELIAQKWFERGYVFQQDKNFDEAIRCYTEVISLKPDEINLSTTYSNLGNLFSDLKRYNEAEIAYRKAIELNPAHATAYYNLGALLGDLKRTDEAEATFRKAIELNPSDAAAYSNLGNTLKDLKRYDEAEAAYRKAIELNPSDATAYNNLVILLRLNNRIEEAMPLLGKIIEIKPDDFNPYLAMASINKQLGKGGSNDHTEKARQFMPEDDWYNRACLESVCDNFDLAFEHLRCAAQHEGFNPAWAWDDPDLQWIRDDPRFTKIVGPRQK